MSQAIDFKDPSNLAYLLAHIVRQESAMSMCVNRLNDSEFDPQGEALPKAVWCIARDFYKEHKFLPNYEQMMLGMRSKIAEQAFASPEWMQRGHQLVYDIFSYPLQPGAHGIGWFSQMLQTFMWQRTVTAKARTAVEQNNFSKTMWETLAQDVQRSTVSTAAEVTPFADPLTAMLGVLPRTPTGVPFLDDALGLGTRPGELYGFLAPSGGGKTTVSNQLAVSLAKRGKLVAAFSYEQAPDNEYFVPVYAAATGIPRQRWELLQLGCPPEQVFDAREMELFLNACKQIKKNAYWFDMSGGASRSGSGGVEEVEAKVRELNERVKDEVDEQGKPRKVHAVIIDWFWPLVVRSYDRQSVKPGHRAMDMRPYAQNVVDDIKAMCQRHGFFGLLTHQANPAEAKKKRDLSFEDAAELKSFAWFMNGCWCLNKMDEWQVASIQFSKSRHMKPSKTILQLLGDYATFKDAGNLVFDQTTQKYVDPEQKNTLVDASGKSLRQQYSGKPSADGQIGSI